jgi:hypothetical protein
MDTTADGAPIGGNLIEYAFEPLTVTLLECRINPEGFRPVARRPAANFPQSCR